MKYDLLIKNGHVVDPSQGIDKVMDILVLRSKLAEVPEGDFEVEETIDASGYLVTPGLIDFHTHTGYRRSDFAFDPDLYGLPCGITSLVDAGSCGSGDFEGMAQEVIPQATVTMKACLHITATGMVTEALPENQSPEFWDRTRLEYLVERYRDSIVGLKARFGNYNKNMSFEPLPEMLDLADHLGLPLVAHVCRTLEPIDDAMGMFRKGDVVAHIYQSSEYDMFDEKGRVRKSILDARNRGVVFDASLGRINHDFKHIKHGLEEGFLPDIISTDVVSASAYRPTVHSLLRSMAVFYGLGMPFNEVLRTVTQNPAKLMGLEDRIGTLKAGAMADIAIFKEVRRPVHLVDKFGGEMDTDMVLVPQMTVKAGRVVYSNIEFVM